MEAMVIGGGVAGSVAAIALRRVGWDVTVYEAYTDYTERAQFYEMYKGAVKTALFVMQGPLVADLSK